MLRKDRLRVGMETTSGIEKLLKTDHHSKRCTMTVENQLQTTQLLSDALKFESRRKISQGFAY